MDRTPTPKDLRGAAAVAQTLAYVAGLAGVVAGGLLQLDGETAMAVVVWVLTFAVGAMLMIAAAIVRGLAALMAHIARVESDVRVLLSDASRRRTDDPYDPRVRERDPWGGHHP
jgi:hypothetical protein